MNRALTIDRERLESYCERWSIVELALFGSVLTDAFGPDSDVDVLVTFAEDADFTLLDSVRMQRELAEVFGRPVDLVSSKALARSRNWLRREEIQSSARVVYAA